MTVSRTPTRPSAFRPRLSSALVLAALLAIGACVEAPRSATPVALPRPTATLAPPAPAPVDWQDWPRTPGSWSYGQDARGSRALFGTAGQDALVVLRCDRAERRVFLSRSGSNATPFTIRTTSATRRLPAQPAGGTPPYVATAFAPTDPLLDAVAFSRGRFTIEQAATPALVLLPYAEVGRVIEDCRG